MDAYVLGFVAVVVFMLLVMVGALIFLSIETDGTQPQQSRINMLTVRTIDTDTIETVDHAGEVQRWQRTV